MNVFKLFFTPILIAVLCISMVGCTATTVLNDINVALTDIEALTPVLIALLPGPYAAVAQQALAFAADASAAWAAVAACHSAGGSAGIVATCITAAIAHVVANVPQVGALGEGIAAEVAKIAGELSAYLQTFGEKSSLAAHAVANGQEIHFTDAQRLKLATLRARATADHDRLSALARR
jgi:hypothetical protein